MIHFSWGTGPAHRPTLAPAANDKKFILAKVVQWLVSLMTTQGVLSITVPVLSQPAAAYCNQHGAEKCWMSVSEELGPPRGERPYVLLMRYQYVSFYCNIIKFFLHIKMCYHKILKSWTSRPVVARLLGLLSLWMSHH
jgi:hypothetical protein